ncbi:MAG: peptide-methionine (S)-S-oxide reductase MsrA [Flavobacteriaceae bacterium]|jgi:peptide-methionine (S)-S-oxide reductase|tara:strand:+ start:179 stop:772 length:594 start_codon:yes stop_codon:yes gene_type:complete
MKFKVRFLIFFFLSISYGQTELKNAYFASGCFWCVESIYESLEGVNDVVSGYSGGWLKNPSYRQVLTGKTGHAESIKVSYNPNQISFSKLVEVFFASHDPTTLNKQGPDIGPHYRSIAFYETNEEKIIIEKEIKRLLDNKVYDLIVTEVKNFEIFYLAESYHQDYKIKNPNNPYIWNVSVPRIEKFKSNYSDLLKKD